MAGRPLTRRRRCAGAAPPRLRTTGMHGLARIGVTLAVGAGIGKLGAASAANYRCVRPRAHLREAVLKYVAQRLEVLSSPRRSRRQRNLPHGASTWSTIRPKEMPCIILSRHAAHSENGPLMTVSADFSFPSCTMLVS